jgi:hypothetical protein
LDEYAVGDDPTVEYAKLLAEGLELTEIVCRLGISLELGARTYDRIVADLGPQAV